MIALAAWGFVLSKALVVGWMLTGAWGARLVPAVASAFGSDVAVLLVAGVVGALVERGVRRPGVAAWTLGALGVTLALWALVNVLLVVEIGRPATVGMRGFGIGPEEARTMLSSPGARLAMVGIGAYAVTAWPIARWATRRVGLRAVLALAAYGVLAIGFVGAQPRIASTYGLHRNAVVELARSALGETPWFARVEESTGDLLPEEFPVPPGEWTTPVTFDRSARPKHVVLWFAESTGARYTSAYDPQSDTTPNLVRVKPHALRFTRYYANVPLSEKGLFGILYGMYPHPSIHSMSRINPRIARTSLMEALASRGWRTGFFTGALLGFGDKQKILAERGFETMIDGESVPGRDQYWHDGWGVDDAAIVAEALRWLDDRPDPEQPQFVVMVPIVPHVPYAMPTHAERPYGETRQGKYLNGLRYADLVFGAFYDGLVDRGLADDTLIVYVGDHGEAFDQHPANAGHASFVYEDNVHVPLLFVHPGLFPSEVTSDRLGCHADLMPTILELVGEPIPDGGDGQSLVSDQFEYRPVFFGAYLRDDLGGVRDGHYKYIRNFDTRFEEVYDLSADPLEAHNLADTFDIERVATWRTWVSEYRAHQRRVLEDYPAAGPSYLERIRHGMRVFVQDGDETTLCRIPRRGLRAIGCEDEPEEVSVGLSREELRGVPRECLTVHPPHQGALVIEFPVLDPPPALIGAGLIDAARLTGGAPVEVTWRIGDQEPTVMTLDDERADAYTMSRLPDVGPVPVRVEVRASEWGDRRGCIILSP